MLKQNSLFKKTWILIGSFLDVNFLTCIF